MTRVGIDARWLKNYYTGIGKYTLGWLSALAPIDQHNEYVLFVDSDFGASNLPKHQLADARNFKLVSLRRNEHAVVPIQLRMLIQDQLMMPLAIRAQNCQLMFFPYFNPPLYGLRRSVITITDLDIYLHRRGYSFHRRAYYNFLLRRASHRAVAFVAISEATKADAVSVLGISPDRIHVVYPSIAEHFRPVDRDLAKTWCAEHYGIVKPFVLYTGGFSERKNVPFLIQAFLRSMDLTDGSSCLVITGNPADYSEIMEAILAAPSEAIVVTGIVPEVEMPYLYSAATALVYPSLFEGFGYPIVEAQRCGTPVITSNSSSIPEVAGTGAVYTSSSDPDDLAAAIIRVIQDPQLRERLSNEGFSNAKRFSAVDSAQRLLAVLEECKKHVSATQAV